MSDQDDHSLQFVPARAASEFLCLLERIPRDFMAGDYPTFPTRLFVFNESHHHLACKWPMATHQAASSDRPSVLSARLKACSCVCGVAYYCFGHSGFYAPLPRSTMLTLCCAYAHAYIYTLR